MAGSSLIYGNQAKAKRVWSLSEGEMKGKGGDENKEVEERAGTGARLSRTQTATPEPKV